MLSTMWVVILTLVLNATGWVYVGCFTDSTASRTLSHNLQTGFADNVTVQNCLAACHGAGSQYEYCGMEMGNQCWADTDIMNGGYAVEDGCTTKCKGEPDETCGGTDRLSLYQSVGGDNWESSMTLKPSSTGKSTSISETTTHVSVTVMVSVSWTSTSTFSPTKNTISSTESHPSSSSIPQMSSIPTTHSENRKSANLTIIIPLVIIASLALGLGILVFVLSKRQKRSQTHENGQNGNLRSHNGSDNHDPDSDEEVYNRIDISPPLWTEQGHFIGDDIFAEERFQTPPPPPLPPSTPSPHQSSGEPSPSPRPPPSTVSPQSSHEHSPSPRPPPSTVSPQSSRERSESPSPPSPTIPQERPSSPSHSHGNTPSPYLPASPTNLSREHQQFRDIYLGRATLPPPAPPSPSRPWVLRRAGDFDPGREISKNERSANSTKSSNKKQSSSKERSSNQEQTSESEEVNESQHLSPELRAHLGVEEPTQEDTNHMTPQQRANSLEPRLYQQGSLYKTPSMYSQESFVPERYAQWGVGSGPPEQWHSL